MTFVRFWILFFVLLLGASALAQSKIEIEIGRELFEFETDSPSLTVFNQFSVSCLIQGVNACEYSDQHKLAQDQYDAFLQSWKDGKKAQLSEDAKYLAEIRGIVLAVEVFLAKDNLDRKEIIEEFTGGLRKLGIDFSDQFNHQQVEWIQAHFIIWKSRRSFERRGGDLNEDYTKRCGFAGF